MAEVTDPIWPKVSSLDPGEEKILIELEQRSRDFHTRTYPLHTDALFPCDLVQREEVDTIRACYAIAF